MGAVKPVGQLYGSPTALTSQYLAWDRYCTYVVQTLRVERRIFLEQIICSRYMKNHTVAPEPRGGVFDVNTKFVSELFTFCCVSKPNKRTYQEQESILFSSSFFVKHYCAKAKKSNPNSLNAGVTK